MQRTAPDATVTMHDINRLMGRAHGPGVDRHGDRGAPLKSYYFPWKIFWRGVMIETHDPGAVAALRVALALAFGLDPGPMGLGLRWYRIAKHPATGAAAWVLEGALQPDGPHSVIFHDHPGLTSHGYHLDECRAPKVATEEDAVRALVLAARWVLENREGR